MESWARRWARGGARWTTSAALGALLLGSARPAAAQSAAASAPGAWTHGAGTLELRLQTVTNVAVGGQLAYAAAPGVAYEPESRRFLVNAIGGAGYFLTPGFALGMDASYTRFADDTSFVALAPFMKLVSSLERWRLGAFMELSPGLLLAKVDDSRATYFQLSGWGGLHIPVTDSAALVLGPSVTLLLRTDKRGPNDVVFGERAGLNVYLPSTPMAPEDRPVLGKGTFELRFQTATHALPGGVLSPQAAHSALYSTESQAFLFNVIGGGGLFLNDVLAFGGEASATLAMQGNDDGRATLLGLAGFVKLVSGMRTFSPGVFVEASPGIFATAEQGETGRARGGAISQLALWAGAHLPLGTTTAFVIGPSVTRFDDLQHPGEGLWVLGARFGLSLYLPSKRRAH